MQEIVPRRSVSSRNYETRWWIVTSRRWRRRRRGGGRERERGRRKKRGAHFVAAWNHCLQRDVSSRHALAHPTTVSSAVFLTCPRASVTHRARNSRLSLMTTCQRRTRETGRRREREREKKRRGEGDREGERKTEREITLRPPNI